MLVLNLPFKALMFLTLMRPSLVLFLVLWLKLVKNLLKVRCRQALLPFLISCLIWLDLVASLPLIKERILVIILLLHFLSLMLGSVLVLMLPIMVWLTPDLRIKKSLLKCNWTIRKRLPRCKMRLKKRLLAFSRRLHARIRKTRYMHKMRCLLINRRSLMLAFRLFWKTSIFPSYSRLTGLCFFFSSRRRHTRFDCDWSSDVCSSDLRCPRDGWGDGRGPARDAARCRKAPRVPQGTGTAQGISRCARALDSDWETGDAHRSEERRVGKECRSRWSPYH